MTLIYCTGWLKLKVVHLNLLPTFASIAASNQRKSRTILFREIQHTATSKISIFQNLFVEQYTIHIAHPMFKYSGIYPTYFLHYEQDNGRRIFLLAGRKRKKCSTSTYVLSTDPTDLSRQGSSTLATLRWEIFCYLVIII